MYSISYFRKYLYLYAVPYLCIMHLIFLIWLGIFLVSKCIWGTWQVAYNPNRSNGKYQNQPGPDDVDNDNDDDDDDIYDDNDDDNDGGTKTAHLIMMMMIMMITMMVKTMMIIMMMMI